MVIFQGCTQAMANSGKSELDAKHTSVVHQYEQIKFNKSHITNSNSLQRLNFFCDILDLVNCVIWETIVLMLFSTFMTEIFLISTKAPESVIQHCNLLAIYLSVEKTWLYSLVN